MNNSFEKLLEKVAERARSCVQENSKRILDSYVHDRSTHLDYLGINDFNELSQQDLISKLSEIKSAEKYKAKFNGFDSQRYMTASTALMIEEERGRTAIEITVADFSKFITGATDAAD